MNFTEQLKNKSSADYKNASRNAKLKASTMYLCFNVINTSVYVVKDLIYYFSKLHFLLMNMS